MSVAEKLWPRQRDAVAFAREKPASLLAMKMGTGKTLTTLALLEEWGATRVFVSCPLAVVRTWQEEAAKHGTPWTVACLDKGGVKGKLKAAECLDELPVSHKMWAVNHESAWRDPLAWWILSASFDVIVLDECHRLKAPSGRAAQFFARLGDRARRA